MVTFDTNNTQLSSTKDYNVSRMIFSDPIAGSIPDSNIEYKRINITTKNKDGTEGELILPTEHVFSFGVSENTSQETGKVNGWTFPLCLWSRDGPTKEEKMWSDTFNKIVDHCITHLVENREEIERYELTRADMTKTKGGLNPLYYKREKFTNDAGKTSWRIVPGTGPTLYTKLIYSKKNDNFLSLFFTENDDSINPLDLMGKYCYADAAVKIESIFIGSKISLQCKLYEAVIKLAKTGGKRLLRPKAQSKVIEYKATSTDNSNPMLDDDDDDSLSDTGSLNDDDDDEPKVPKNVKKKPVKRKTKRATRKSKA